MRTATNGSGIDWLEVVVPPKDEDYNYYTLRLNLTFLLSNWTCIYGSACAGIFPKQSSVINDDAGCCVDSFYLSDRKDMEHVEAQIKKLTPEDWDERNRKHVEANGWARVFDGTEDGWNAKGKVFEGACVFANRNNGTVGSTGKIGCAFVHMGNRLGEGDHVDVMPEVCWQLPLKMTDDDENLTYTIDAWTVDKWFVDNDAEDKFEDESQFCSWWCVDSPDAYVGEKTVFRSMERELRKMLGDRDYDLCAAAIEERLALGNVYPKMPGATLNDGRPLLPLLVGPRESRREPSDYRDRLQRHIEEHFSDQPTEPEPVVPE